MPKPADSDVAYVIVTERPNKVYVACNGEIHTANWRTQEGRGLRNVKGNEGILAAAMLKWAGEDTSVTTFGELEAWSQGYGAWDEN